MKLGPALAIPVLYVALAALGCSSGDSNPGPGGSGGATPTASGGSGAGTGGAGTGGVSAGTGGSVAPGTGGANGTGGATVGTGGATQSGGANGTGGLVGGSGGASSGGGATGSGGTAGPGGATGSGGAGGGGAATEGRGGNTANGGGGQVGQGGRGGAAGNLKAAMVVRGAGTATAGDMVMLGRLAARGIQVTLFSDAAVTAAAVASMNLIVISSSAESGPLSTKLRDVAVPMLCIENGQYRNQGMTGTSLNTNYGEATGQTAVTILPGATAMVGDLTGTVTISRTAGPLGWGAPADTALKGATQVGSAGHLAVFGYEKGAQMVGMVAPARRAGFAIREALAANLTADGIKLFDAVLEWVLQ